MGNDHLWRQARDLVSDQTLPVVARAAIRDLLDEVTRLYGRLMETPQVLVPVGPFLQRAAAAERELIVAWLRARATPDPLENDGDQRALAAAGFAAAIERGDHIA